MQSIGMSRRFFGCIRRSLPTAALVVGMMVLAGKVYAQDQSSSSKPASMPESSNTATYAGTPTSLRDLVLTRSRRPNEGAVDTPLSSHVRLCAEE